jgi:hypothetical protein
MLRALGLSHRDIGQLTGDSPTRVGQLVRRGHFGVGEIQDRAAQADTPLPPRAQRLRDLEREPPAWLVDVIGGRPRSIRKRSQHSNERRGWRRAALALDDYRRHAGEQAVRSDGLSRVPRDGQGKCPHARAVAAVDDLMRERGLDAGREAGR